MLIIIERLLNDAVLGFLALVSLFLMITPSIFSLSDYGLYLLFLVEYSIIFLFATEYVAALLLAENKKSFMLNRWRILDAYIILLALVAFLPVTPEVLRNSPVLRLLRLGRLALLGTRSGLALKPVADASAVPAMVTPPELSVRALGESGEKFESIPWEQALQRIASVEQDWLFISGITEDRLKPVADVLSVPLNALQGLFQSSVPRFGRLENFSILFFRYPVHMKAGTRLQRTPVMLVGTADNVVVLSRERTNLETYVEQRLPELDANMPRMVRATIALAGEIIRAYTEVTEHLETTLIKLETEQATLNDADFLARSFTVRADILRVRSSLKHLKGVIRDLSQGQLSIPGLDTGDREYFRLLADDAGDLYESIEDQRESLQSLVDLRINVSSFQMNRVMRLLALLTTLALIPATAGGLLGMNLQDTPWPGTLAQVSFGLAAGMALSLYIFAIKGWLR